MDSDLKINELVSSHIGLANKIANQWPCHDGDRDGMFSICLEQLIKVADKFDPLTSRFTFGAIARRSMKYALLNEYRKKTAIKRGGISPPLSLDYEIAENGLSLHDILEGKNQLNPNEILEQSERRERLKTIISGLSERERLVISLLAGIERNPLDQKSVAAELGITQQRISKIFTNCLLKISKIEKGICARRKSIIKPNVGIQSNWKKDNKVNERVNVGLKNVGRGIFYNPIKIIKIDAMLEHGKSLREIAMATGTSKITVGKRRLWLIRNNNAVFTCQCGQMAGHRGWCSERFANSQRRKEFISKWHNNPKGEIKNSPSQLRAMAHQLNITADLIGAWR